MKHTKSYYSHNFIRKPFETLVQSDTGQGVCDLQVDWVVLDSVQSQLCINLQKKKIIYVYSTIIFNHRTSNQRVVNDSPREKIRKKHVPGIPGASG